MCRSSRCGNVVVTCAQRYRVFPLCFLIWQCLLLCSFAGIGKAETAKQALAAVTKNARAQTRWKYVQVLVIDEISMMSASLLDALDAVARTYHGKDSSKFFGGIQLILCGDFFQLPPVVQGNKDVHYAFDAKSWQAVAANTFVLQKVYRQSDMNFVRLLDKVRQAIPLNDKEIGLLSTFGGIDVVVLLCGVVIVVVLWCCSYHGVVVIMVL